MDNKKFDFPLKKQNLYIILVGLAINILGYLLMIGGGSEDPSKFDASELFSNTRITLAPIFIVLGFAVMIYGIMKRAPKSGSENIRTLMNNLIQRLFIGKWRLTK